MKFASMVAIDRNYLPYWQESWPTWRRYWPWLLSRPMFVAYDQTQIEINDFKFVDHPYLVPWPWPPSYVNYESQREKMLSAFMFMPPRYLPDWSDYWLKVDVDVICTRAIPEEWPLSWWFDDKPVCVAPGWGYSKPADTIQRLDDWGDTIRDLKRRPRLDPEVLDGAEVVKYPRICSWLAFFSDSYLRYAASMMPSLRPPIPSQDGVHWYIAERLGLPIRKEKMGQWGFKTISGLNRLRREAAQCLASPTC